MGIYMGQESMTTVLQWRKMFHLTVELAAPVLMLLPTQLTQCWSFVCQSGEKFLNLSTDWVKRFPKLTVALTL